MAQNWRGNLRELLFGNASLMHEADEDRLATDPDVSYYNYRFVRHRAEGDIVSDPSFLWSARAYWKNRGGLLAHLLQEAEALDGLVFTDVLIIISAEDWRHTQARVITSWDDSVRELLAEKYDALLARRRLEAINPHRGFQLRLLHEGEDILAGERFGLEPGEFITCLLPHIYCGPVASSELMAEVYLRFPSWEGELRKVGALYSDQLSFTVGGHWLDSYQDPQLKEAALYNLHHFPDTPRLEHRINLDLHERYQLGAVTRGPGDEELQPVIRRDGKSTVFEVMIVRPTPPKEAEDIPSEQREREPREDGNGFVGAAGSPVEEHVVGEPGSGSPAKEHVVGEPGPGSPAQERAVGVFGSRAEDRAVRAAGSCAEGRDLDGEGSQFGSGWGESGSESASNQGGAASGLADETEGRRKVAGAVGSADEGSRGGQLVTSSTSIARPGNTLPGELATGARLTLGRDPGLGARTIVPEMLDEKVARLSERGVLLQRVHFPQLMRGYTVNLGQTGHIGLTVRHPFARARVEGAEVWLEVLMPGTFLDGERVEVGSSSALAGKLHRISYGATRFEYRDLRRKDLSRWPYLAEIRRPALTRSLKVGKRYRIGRNRKACAVVLPDHSDQSNILWQQQLDADAHVAGSRGAIRRAQIYTDSIMVAGEHAELALEGAIPLIRNLSSQCFVYVRRADGQLAQLMPEKKKKDVSIPLRSGDEILLGNTLFRVSYDELPIEGTLATPAARKIESLGPDSAEKRDDQTQGGPREKMRQSKPLPAGDEQPRGKPSLDGRTRRASVEPSGSASEGPPAQPAPENLRRQVAREAYGNAKTEQLRPPARRSKGMADDKESLDEKHASAGSSKAASGKENKEMPPYEARGDWSWHSDRGTWSWHSDRGTWSWHSDRGTWSWHSERGTWSWHSDRAADKDDVAPGEAPPVVARDEASWSMDLRRSGRLVQIGWAVAGMALSGNHMAASMVIPENRIEPAQSFKSADYFTAFVRGDRARLTRLRGPDVRLLQQGKAVEHAESTEDLSIEIDRRDSLGEVDFTVKLDFSAETIPLPRPRARLLAIRLEPSNEGLFTWGLPDGMARMLQLGDLKFRARSTREGVRIEDYLESYRLPNGSYREFYWLDGDSYRTAPEDGTPLTLPSGTVVVIGQLVFRAEC